MKKGKRLLAIFMASLIIVGMIPAEVLAVENADISSESNAVFETETSSIEMFDSTQLIYGSDEGITRAEWLHNLAIMFEMTVEDEDLPDNYFSDLDETSAYYRDVLLTVQFGVVNIEAGGEVRPEELATRDFVTQTLNYCLGFQLDEDAEYSFEDVEDCTNADDVQIAVNRGWFLLEAGLFLPEKEVTRAEVENIVNDTQAVLLAAYVEEGYDSTYEFAEDVIVVPEGTEVMVDENGIITIKECPVEIAEGSKFAVYINGIPSVYQAETVSVDGENTVISGSEVSQEEGFEVIDAQGIIEADITELETVDGSEITYVNETSGVSYQSAEDVVQTYGAKASSMVTTEIKHELQLGSGVSVDVTVKINNPKIKYKVSTREKSASAVLTCDTTVSYTVKGDLTKAYNSDEILVAMWGVPGVGGIEINIALELSGSLSAIQKGYLEVGIAYGFDDGFRTQFGFKSKSWALTVEATGAVGLNVKVGITQLPILNAYLYAQAGGKAKLEDSDYKDGLTPERCTHFAAHLYASIGGEASIEIGFYKKSKKVDVELYNEKNSPIRVVHHYEDGIEVQECTREKEYSYYTEVSSQYAASGWKSGVGFAEIGGNGSGNGSGSGNSIALYSYTVDEDGNATITGYNGIASSLIIPEQIDGNTVVAIGKDAFKNNIRLRAVIISDTIRTIKDNAFKGCTNLEDIVLSSNLEEIGYNAFENCTNLRTIDLPDSITTIKNYAFANTGLIQLKLPKNVVNLGRNIIEQVENVTEIIIPKSVTDAGDISGGPLSNSYVETVVFEDGMTKVPAYVCSNAKNLQEVILPDTITVVGSDAFENCTNLTTINLPDTITRIGSNAFENCASLKKIDLPDSVTDIGSYAFANTGLLELKLPKNVTDLGRNIIEQVENVTEIIIPKSVKSAGDTSGGALGNSYVETVEFEDGLTKVPAYICWNAKHLQEVEIPDTVTSVGSEAFKNCTKLTNIDLPQTITKLGVNAFENSGLIEIVIPNSVTYLGNNLFINSSSLEKVVLPDACELISVSMFEGCSSLEEIDLPSTVTKIENRAFYNCDSLVEIVIPPTVSSLGNNVFYDCDALADVSLGAGITSIPQSAFAHCDALETIVLPYRIKTIEANAFKECVNLKNITIPRVTTTIASSTFSYPAKMTIYGVAGTYAETFADENNITFVSQEIPATNVELDSTEITINNGAKKVILMTVTPANFTDEVSWKSTDTSVVTITDDGTVKGVGLGTATIKLIVGDISLNCKVTVVQPVTSITLNKTSLSLEALETYQLKATVKPTTAVNREVEWSSSDESVVTVDENGFVKALQKGTATITVTAKDGSGVTKSCVVTVTNTAIIVNNPKNIESEHNYPNNFSDFWMYSSEGASYLDITFDSRTNIEEDFDYLYIYDGNGTEIGKYTGTSLAGTTVRVTGDTVKIQLVSDGSGNEWGFKVTQILTDKTGITEKVFEDVHTADYYYAPVLWAVEEGITDGWTPTQFAPNMACTRGQVVTFLWRAAGEPKVTTANPFTDVAENAYYYDAVLWAVENGITDGWTPTQFAPDMQCTRGQIVTFLWRAAGEPSATTGTNPFTDVVTSAYYYQPILWAVKEGITDGWTPTQFAPEMECTRGQIVTFIYRYRN